MIEPYDSEDVKDARSDWGRMTWAVQREVRRRAEAGERHPDPKVARTAEIWAWVLLHPPQRDQTWWRRLLLSQSLVSALGIYVLTVTAILLIDGRPLRSWHTPYTIAVFGLLVLWGRWRVRRQRQLAELLVAVSEAPRSTPTHLNETDSDQH